MRAPLLFLPAIVVLAATLISCGASEEQAPGNAANPTATQAPATSRAPSPPPSPSPATVPADWTTYADPRGLFTVPYPPNWFESGGGFSSYDVSALTTTRRPPEAVAVEVGYNPAVGSNTCGGTLSVDPKTGEALGPLPGAVPASLGGQPAWQIVRIQGDPAIAEEDLTRIQRISAIYKGYCVLITAYFTQQNPDVATFLQIAGSFQFKF